MKKSLILLLLLIFINHVSFGQRQKFDGYWFGKLKTSDDREASVILKIENNTAHQMSYSEQEGLQVSDRDKEYTQSLRNNLCYTWLNMGGVWSETQTFMLSYLNSEELQIIWIRQVNNIKEGTDENEEWYVIGRGTMEKLSEKEVEELAVN